MRLSALDELERSNLMTRMILAENDNPEKKVILGQAGEESLRLPLDFDIRAVKKTNLIKRFKDVLDPVRYRLGPKVVLSQADEMRKVLHLPASPEHLRVEVVLAARLKEEWVLKKRRSHREHPANLICA